MRNAFNLAGYGYIWSSLSGVIFHGIGTGPQRGAEFLGSPGVFLRITAVWVGD